MRCVGRSANKEQEEMKMKKKMISLLCAARLMAALTVTAFAAPSRDCLLYTSKDMTRVARLNEDMWTELFFDNKPALLDEIEGLIDRLEAYAEALRQNDREKMHILLKEGRERKEIVG